MLSKKSFVLAIAFMLVAIVALAACGSPATPAPAPTQAPAQPTAAPAQPTAAPAEPTKAPEQPTAAPSAGAVELRYMLWDSAQQPAYEACAKAFTAKNPNINVKVEQAGWDDYWNTIQTGFVSGTAPDVFTDHLAKFPEFAVKEQIMDINPMVAQDKVDTSVYLPGLADLWVREGKRYGLPKDWDTIAIIYNKDMLEKAGIDPKTMETWTWNGKDGGSFTEAIAKLTLDKNGKNGLDPAFDKNNVAQYGFIHQGSGGFAGQTQWSMFAASNGFKFTDGPWTKKYYYDDPKLAETMDWYVGLIEKGYAPKQEDVTSLGASTMFQSGKGALTTDGSWMINNYLDNSKFPVGFGLLPTGPEGRKSMFNGLADSIWVGTKHPQESWQWVKFLASQECQDIVGATGVVFPAIPSGVEKSLKVRADKGIDISAYTKEALDPAGTFLFPITDHGSEIANIMGPTMDSILLFQAKPAAALKEANDKVNALFQ